jgi:diguanylate cyclase (GGDEF)-like protein
LEIAVLVADIDLRTVCDAYGPGVADTVLSEFGQRLAASLRPGDTLARIGDDEFAMICPDLAGRQQAMVVVDRLRATAKEPLTVGDRQQIMTLSVGVAFAPGDTHDQAASLLRRAGRLMSGRGPRHSTPHEDHRVSRNSGGDDGGRHRWSAAAVAAVAPLAEPPRQPS